MLIRAIDPGLRGCGVADFDSRELIQARYVANPCAHDIYKSIGRCKRAAEMAFATHRGNPDVIVVEYPQVYTVGHTRDGVDPNDLLPLAGILSALAALCPAARIVEYAPREWKGSVPKPTMTERIRKYTIVREWTDRIYLPAASLAHNVYDAIGLGKHHLSVIRKTALQG